LADPAPRVSAIVLAGGRSSRFGGQKLQALLDGIPLLDLAIRAVAEVADEVVVVGPAEGGVGLTDLDAIPDRVRVKVVRDPVADAGPLVGLSTGLSMVTGERAIVVGGDMPRLARAVLDALAAGLGESSASAPGAVVLASSGDRRPLPMALDVASARPAVDAALASRQSSLQAALDRLNVRAIAESEWRRLDPEGGSLIDVDRRSDLDRLRR
jgi:molybdopterin-guanine dinucleotide biosynthesis protein A